MSKDQVSVERVIAAEPAAIFAILSDSSRHREIDGSGMVQGTRGPGGPLALGSRFGMSMRLKVPYSTINEVVEFEQDRRIAWRTLAPWPLTYLFTGRTWRYELEPTDGGTRVRETWDISTEAAPGRPAVRRMAEATERNMARSLKRLEQAVTGAAE